MSRSSVRLNINSYSGRLKTGSDIDVVTPGGKLDHIRLATTTEDTVADKLIKAQM